MPPSPAAIGTHASARSSPDRNITFLGNAAGAFLFNLIRLARNRETFDIVYLDGHHSIYVDLAAAIAAVRLLRPSALFLFDDVRFLGRRHLIQTTAQHADANEAKQLTEDEPGEAHVTIIIRHYLIPCSALKWSGRGRILIGSRSERQNLLRGCSFDGSPAIGLRDRRLHRCHERSRQGSPSWHA